MDIEASIEMPMQKDHRVCSAHFDKDDFIIPKRAADPKNPTKVSLKKNAILRVQQVATDRLEVKLFAYLSCYIWLFTIGGEALTSFEKVKNDLVSCPGGLTSINGA